MPAHRTPEFRGGPLDGEVVPPIPKGMEPVDYLAVAVPNQQAVALYRLSADGDLWFITMRAVEA